MSTLSLCCNFALLQTLSRDPLDLAYMLLLYATERCLALSLQLPLCVSPALLETLTYPLAHSLLMAHIPDPHLHLCINCITHLVICAYHTTTHTSIVVMQYKYQTHSFSFDLSPDIRKSSFRNLGLVTWLQSFIHGKQDKDIQPYWVAIQLLPNMEEITCVEGVVHVHTSQCSFSSFNTHNLTCRTPSLISSLSFSLHLCIGYNQLVHDELLCCLSKPPRIWRALTYFLAETLHTYFTLTVRPSLKSTVPDSSGKLTVGHVTSFLGSLLGVWVFRLRKR